MMFELDKAVMIKNGFLISWLICTVFVLLQKLLLSTAPTVHVPITVTLLLEFATDGLIITVAFGVGFTELDGTAGTVQVIFVFGLLLIPVITILASLQVNKDNGCM